MIKTFFLLSHFGEHPISTRVPEGTKGRAAREPNQSLRKASEYV
jgi:hypothetical protein